MSAPPPELTGVWLHSQEEDTASTVVYRRRGYSFPPSRGRDAIELRPDGTWVGHDGGPDDRGRQVTSRWETSDDAAGPMLVRSDAGGTSARRIVSWTPEVLVLGRP